MLGQSGLHYQCKGVKYNTKTPQTGGFISVAFFGKIKFFENSANFYHEYISPLGHRRLAWTIYLQSGENRE